MFHLQWAAWKHTALTLDTSILTRVWVTTGKAKIIIWFILHQIYILAGEIYYIIYLHSLKIWKFQYFITNYKNTWLNNVITMLLTAKNFGFCTKVEEQDTDHLLCWHDIVSTTITLFLDFWRQIETFWGLSLKIPFGCQWHQFALVWEDVGEEFC